MLDLYRDSKGKTALHYPHFPTRMQAVVWRNWGLVPVERLASVLGASDEQVIELAEGMGLPVPMNASPLWLTRGYITLIRSNWHLLTYEQLMDLLGWTEDQLAFALKEDDFLWHKLGNLKPQTEPVKYRPLTEEEKRLTVQLKEQISEYFPAGKYPLEDPPFGFLDRFVESRKLAQAFVTEQQPTPSSEQAGADSGSQPVILSSEWRVVYSSNSKFIPHFVERFVNKLDLKWGVKLTAEAQDETRLAQSQARTIRLRIEANSELLAESHEIYIATDDIVLTAVDEQGCLRGLQWLASQMEANGGPKLQPGRTQRKTKFDLRYIYSYFAVFGDPLVDPELDPYPDGLLEALSELGVNGVWLHICLYNLIPWDEAPELSQDWERRLDGLRKLTERAAKFGIGIYLYFNEPRAMPLPFFDKHPDWKGHPSHDGTQAALCTSLPEVQQYLRNNTARLFREVPELAGLFTITRSENLTSCYSHAMQDTTQCPRCKQRTPQEVIAEVNRCIAEGAFSVKPDARIICWTWAWSAFTEEQLAETINLLPDGVRVMSVSEELAPTNVAGTKGNVIDYSISIVGPSDRSRVTWQAAQRRGLQAMAKVQLNNTWECSAVPYLPVLDLVEQHLNNLAESGVSGLQLTWTLGGYPSPNLEMASQYYWETVHEAAGMDGKTGGSGGSGETKQPGVANETSFSAASPSKKEMLLGRTFGQPAAEVISEAVTLMSEAFREFPFHVGTLYVAPQNYGPMNLLYLEPTGYRATMIGFPYDDLTTWKSIYAVDDFETQFRLLSEKWKQGLDRLIEAEPLIPVSSRSVYTEWVHCALGAYDHFRSTSLQITFVKTRDRFLQADDAGTRAQLRSQLLDIIDEEIELALSLYGLVRRDSRIGYEATNHYYYTHQALQEKVLNCLYVKEQLADGTISSLR